jgi:ferritin-like metal-binding protein YciE
VRDEAAFHAPRTSKIQGENHMHTGHELLLHELKDMLDGERQLVEALQELASDSSNQRLKKAFASHREETMGHIERLEECLQILEEKAESTECAGIKGLVEEKKAFMEEDPAEDILDVFHVGAAIKAESYEINAYESMLRLARAMRHREVVRLLNQNLREEKAALSKMRGFSRSIKPAHMMTEREGARGKRRAA